MAKLLFTICSYIAIGVLVDAASYIPSSFIHDYVKDGRPVDGPFPSSLKNIPYYCYQSPSKGPCERMFVVYFFDMVRRKCLPMLYSGCGGNENRFTSKGSCETHCESRRPL